MANKEAAVRLTLKAGSFLGGLQQVSAAVQGMAAKAQSALAGPFSAGLKEAGKAAKGLGGQVVGTLKQAATFGGIFAGGAAIKHAQDIIGKYSDLAFTMSRATGKAISWQEIQKQIEPTAIASKRSSDELADAMGRIFAETGDAGYSAASLLAVGKAATASGKPVAELADLAGVLQKKFGATAATLPGLMATALEKTSGGGAPLEQVTGSFGRLATEARAAGLTGREGLATVLGMIRALKDQGMEEEIAARGMRMLFQQLKEGTAQSKAFEKQGIKFKPDTGPLDKIREILLMGSKSGAILEKVFGRGDIRNVVDNLTQPFDNAYNKAKAAGATDTDARKAGMDAFDASLKGMAKTTYTAAQMMEDATKREAGAKRSFALAMETFSQEFNKPEVTQAFKDMAAQAPKVAKLFAKLVSFTMEHPLLAAGGYAAGKIGGAGIGGAIGVQAAGGIGAKIGSELMATVASHGGWKTAGMAMGVAAAGYIAFKVGEKLGEQVVAPHIAEGQDRVAAMEEKARQARELLHNPKATVAQRTQAQTELQGLIKDEKKSGTGTLESVFGWISSMVQGGPTAGEQHDQALKSAERASQLLIEAAQKSADVLTRGSQTAATNIANAKPSAAPGGGTGNGLPPAPGNAPGFVR